MFFCCLIVIPTLKCSFRNKYQDIPLEIEIEENGYRKLIDAFVYNNVLSYSSVNKTNIYMFV